MTNELRSFKEWCELRKSDGPQPYTFKELEEFAKMSRDGQEDYFDKIEIYSPEDEAILNHIRADDSAYHNLQPTVHVNAVEPSLEEQRAKAVDDAFVAAAEPYQAKWKAEQAAQAQAKSDAIKERYAAEQAAEREAAMNEVDGNPDALEDKDMAGAEAQMESTFKSDDSREEACVDFDRVIKSLTAKGYSEDQIIGAFDRIVKSATETVMKAEDEEEPQNEADGNPEPPALQ